MLSGGIYHKSTLRPKHPGRIINTWVGDPHKTIMLEAVSITLCVPMFIIFRHFSLDYLPRIREKFTLRELNLTTAFNLFLMSLMLKTNAH